MSLSVKPEEMVSKSKDENGTLAPPDSETGAGHQDASPEGLLGSVEKSEPLLGEASQKAASLYFNIKVYKKMNICIFKPLVPLKFVLFLLYGANAAVMPFVIVYLKQIGLTVTELSTMFLILPISQPLFNTVSGVIADKIGTAKPVLIGIVFTYITCTFCLTFIPNIKFEECGSNLVHFRRNLAHLDNLTAEASCRLSETTFEVKNCKVEEAANEMACLMTQGSYDSTLSFHVRNSYEFKGQCLYDGTIFRHFNVSNEWCDDSLAKNFSMSCQLSPQERCAVHETRKTIMLSLTFILLILYFSSLTTSFRILDVAVMSLVKQHGDDFGRQRVWSMLGPLVCSSLSGHIVNATSSPGNEKNYRTLFYIFIGQMLLSLFLIWKLKVRIDPPGKNMWKKSLVLLKNPDVIAFMLVLFVLGACYHFSNYFLPWYMTELNASSFLIGFLPAISSFYGLPFLYLSKWWLKKVGCRQQFLMAFAGYALLFAGCALMRNAWWTVALKATDILIYHLLWVAVVTHSHDLAPPGLRATVIASAGGLHFGVGKGSGSLIGGQIMAAYGARTAYKMMAGISAASAALYLVYLLMRRWKHSQYKKSNNVQVKVNDLDNECKRLNATKDEGAA